MVNGYLQHFTPFSTSPSPSPCLHDNLLSLRRQKVTEHLRSRRGKRLVPPASNSLRNLEDRRFLDSQHEVRDKPEGQRRGGG
ncbi:hypothetical protein CHARACLAT_021012 [Characodon lateralis]|uniref:Uncharacterized protein n=1 Tax=Characodon lateralis TaxID=208331 RepID=A0ABU7DCE0_9TELE|nr:hypothetical protein [Characodon lateralis]